MQSALHKGRMKPHGQLRELFRSGLRMGSGLRIPVSAQGRDHLLDEPDLAIRGRPHGTQVTRLQTEPAQIRHKPGNGHRLGVVAALGGRSDQAVRLPLVEVALGDLGGRQQLGAADPGRGGPSGLRVPAAVGQVPRAAPDGRAACSPRARASRCSRMTFSGR